MGTMAGQMSGLTREQLVAQCMAKYPDPADFELVLAQATAVAEKQIAQAQAKLQPGQELCVGYLADELRHVS